MLMEIQKCFCKETAIKFFISLNLHLNEIRRTRFVFRLKSRINAKRCLLDFNRLKDILARLAFRQADEREEGLGQVAENVIEKIIGLHALSIRFSALPVGCWSVLHRQRRGVSRSDRSRRGFLFLGK